jgi:hypothetical protein
VSVRALRKDAARDLHASTRELADFREWAVIAPAVLTEERVPLCVGTSNKGRPAGRHEVQINRAQTSAFLPGVRESLTLPRGNAKLCGLECGSAAVHIQG